MWNKSIRRIMQFVLVAGISSTTLWGVGGGCDPGLSDVSGFGSSGSGFGSNNLADAQILGLQGDLETSCGGFGCNFDFSSDF